MGVFMALHLEQRCCEYRVQSQSPKKNDQMYSLKCIWKPKVYLQDLVLSRTSTSCCDMKMTGKHYNTTFLFSITSILQPTFQVDVRFKETEDSTQQLHFLTFD